MTTTVAEKVRRLERKLADAARGGDTMTATVDRFERGIDQFREAAPRRRILPQSPSRVGCTDPWRHVNSFLRKADAHRVAPGVNIV